MGASVWGTHEGFEPPPSLAPARDRLCSQADEGAPPSELVQTIESDLGLTIRVLTHANRRSRDRAVASVSNAVEELSRGELAALARSTGAVPVSMGRDPRERLRLHALATHGAALRLGNLAGLPEPDELLTAALLHDIGKLAMYERDPQAAARVDLAHEPPEQRLAREREEFGTTHPALGAELVRGWGLPVSLCDAIECHHTAVEPGPAATVRLADLLAHFGHGRRIDLDVLIDLSRCLGLDSEAMSLMMYELPSAVSGPRTGLDPCPLSERERAVLRHLAEGKVYKQIAGELGVSSSTVRSHLHRIYTRIGAADRTQAVLLATERGWI